MRIFFRRLHRGAAVLLALFIVLHLAIHLTAYVSIDWHLAALSFVQGLYRNPLVEPMLITIFLAQTLTGLAFVRRKIKQPVNTRWHWAQIISGGYLAVFILAHISAALMARVYFGVETNFYWPAGTLTVMPLAYGFAPYYYFGVVSIFVHLAAALHFKARQTKVPLVLVVVGVILAGVILLPFAGVLYKITLPLPHQAYFNAYLGMLGY